MFGKKSHVTPLELRKQLLIAESELNRAQLVQDWQAVADGVRSAADQARTLSSVASAAAALVQKLLPVLDHFEMAQSAAQNAQAPQSAIAALQNGITMIQQQLKGILAGTGLEEVDANGKPFDPTLHEAVMQMETADAPEGQVVQQIRRGYKLQDRLLRPAAVVVAKKPSAPPAA